MKSRSALPSVHLRQGGRGGAWTWEGNEVEEAEARLRGLNFILGKGEGELQGRNDMFYTERQETEFTKVYFYPGRSQKRDLKNENT